MKYSQKSHFSVGYNNLTVAPFTLLCVLICGSLSLSLKAPFRLGFILLSRVLWLSVLVVMLGGLLEPEAAAQTVSFGAKTDSGTGARSRSVAVGDFNGDGKLDLVAASGGATVSILLGTGTGSFGAKTDFGTGSLPLSVAVGDFNGDGKLDLAVANLGSTFVNDPGPATVSILLNTGPTGPIDDPRFFVRQHYLDFLNREPDAAGLAFWTNEITSCGSDAQCVEVKRINVSAAFFLSIEFQQTGYLV
jgi:hypothetical protein